MISSMISMEILVIVRWQGIQLVLTQAAYYELIDLKFDLYDVLEILERGSNCERSKRAKGTIEKCLRKKGKRYKAVVVKSTYLGDPAWKIIHVGKI
ncbi:MAG: hypothetical protein V3T58_02615 [Candidatus Hydrothermarchaeales archaeon]